MPRLSSKQTRILIGTLLVAAVAGLLALDHRLESRVGVTAVITLLGLQGYLEFAKMAGMRRGTGGGTGGVAFLGLLATTYFLVLAWWQGHEERDLSAEWVTAGFAGYLLAATAFLALRRDFKESFPAVLAGLLGVSLFGLLLSFLVRIYHLGTPDAGLIRGTVFFLGVKGTDIVGYLAGSAIGRRHLFPASPGKTVEGTASALLYSAAWFAAAGALWPERFFGWSEGILFGIILGTTSLLGDLSESLIKRYYGVKDSGRLLPEFGGVLDLIDSFLFSAFAFWCLLA